MTNIFMQVWALLCRLERKLARTCGAAKDQRCSKMTSLPTAGLRDGKIRLVSYRREGYEPKLRSYEDAVLAHDDGARCPSWVNRVGSPHRSLLPHFPQLQTSRMGTTTSEKCQYRTWPLRPHDRFRLTASPHIESALAEQNEINEAPAKSRSDRPNRRIKAVVGRLNMH